MIFFFRSCWYESVGSLSLSVKEGQPVGQVVVVVVVVAEAIFLFADCGRMVEGER